MLVIPCIDSFDVVIETGSEVYSSIANIFAGVHHGLHHDPQQCLKFIWRLQNARVSKDYSADDDSVGLANSSGRHGFDYVIFGTALTEDTLLDLHHIFENKNGVAKLDLKVFELGGLLAV